MEGSYNQYRIRVSAVIFGERGELLVVQHSRHGRTFWTFPGGFPELGESLRDALIREVREETGYTIEHGDLHAIAELGGTRWEPPRIEIIFQGTVNHAEPPAPRTSDRGLKPQWRAITDIQSAFLPTGVLAAAIDGRYGKYLGNITEDLGLRVHDEAE